MTDPRLIAARKALCDVYEALKNARRQANVIDAANLLLYAETRAKEAAWETVEKEAAGATGD